MEKVELTLLLIYIIGAIVCVLSGLHHLIQSLIPNISTKYPPRNAFEYDISKHRSWGNRISWDKKGESIYGHLSRRPDAGDFLIQKENDGTTSVYQIISVKKEIDPPDMFFADVKFYGKKENLSNYSPVIPYTNAQQKGFIV